ncbi:2-hydroxy-palmitic acid dioxygenase mpo1-like [Folsomia candida]|uniref:2-hydroxy-palmitic acid dioxygenase mpo1-like n=1 Tax=Folsomia candida TaxID=158441 RepID=UPI001604E72E|nr:2-hydroxy-palmitic acid dioxygenase mpo1-like [Folsomia candida]
MWSAFVLSEYIPPQVPFIPENPLHPPNITLITALFYAGVYIMMDKNLGALLVLVSLVTAHRFYLGAQATWGHPAWQVAAVLHVLCWIAQFIGHGAFEGRAPALLGNMMQAFVMAPLFVLLEVLFFFGYRKDFQKKMWIRVEAEIAKLKKATTSGKKGKK